MAKYCNAFGSIQQTPRLSLKGGIGGVFIEFSRRDKAAGYGSGKRYTILPTGALHYLYLSSPPEESERVAGILKDIVKKGALIVSLENINLHKDGRRVVLETSGVPIFNEAGKITGYLGVGRDITERKQVEEQMKQNLKEKEVLLSEIHHRVKNNMQVISSLLKLQSAKIEDKKYVDLFKESENRIISMSLVHETLYQSKDFANIDFNGYVKSIANGLIRSYALTPNKIKLNTKIEDVSLGLDHAIPCGLIINELISNSLKYAFPKDREGEIKIVLRAINSDEIELTVSDDGIGIPAEIDILKTESLGLQLVQLLAFKSA